MPPLIVFFSLCFFLLFCFNVVFSVFFCYFLVGPKLAKVELAEVELNILGDPRLHVCQAPNAFICVSPCGSILGPFWVHFGSILGPFWVHFGSILGPFCSLSEC